MGAVSRVAKSGDGALVYVFGPRREVLPDEFEVPPPTRAAWIAKVGVQGFRNGTWPILPRRGEDPSAWPLPSFVQVEPQGRAWREEYEDVFGPPVRRTQIPVRDIGALPESGAAGWRYAERYLGRILTCAMSTSGPVLPVVQPAAARALEVKDEASDSILTLDVLGYQFPAAREFWDANWLVIRMAGQDQQGPWEFTDACLLTWELQWLGRWLEALGQRKIRLLPEPGDVWHEHMRPGLPLVGGAGFLEPYLQVDAVPAGDVITLVVECGSDPDAQRKQVLVVRHDALLAAGASVLRAAGTYPFRATLRSPA